MEAASPGRRPRTFDHLAGNAARRYLIKGNTGQPGRTPRPFLGYNTYAAVHEAPQKGSASAESRTSSPRPLIS